MKLRFDTVLSLIMLGAFFLPWGQIVIPSEDSMFGTQVSGSGYVMASHPEIQAVFLYIVPALALIVLLTSLMPFNNRLFRILAGLIPIGAVIWAVMHFSGVMLLGVFDFLELLPAFLNWGFYISLACAIGLFLNGFWGLRKRKVG